jgi:oxygen-independent coproporphyrinogen-3 oxidase
MPAVEIDLDVIRRFDGHGPRYTSYPTADRFVESFDAAAYESWLARRNVGGSSAPARALCTSAFLQHAVFLLRL